MTREREERERGSRPGIFDLEVGRLVAVDLLDDSNHLGREAGNLRRAGEARCNWLEELHVLAAIKVLDWRREEKKSKCIERRKL